jgi:cytochrome P450
MAERLAWYARMRRTAPVAEAPDGAWDVFSYDGVRAALSDHATFSSARAMGGGNVLGDSLIATDPPRHRQLRALVDRAFTPRAVQALAPRIQHLATDLLDRFAGPELDFVAAFAAPLPVLVIAEILGVPTEDRADFKRWSDAVVTGDMGGTRALAGYFGRLIAQRRAAGAAGTDLISVLMAAEEAGQRLSESEVLGFCVLLLVAGNETTTNLLANTVQILSEEPAARAALAADPALWPGAIEESLRFRSPVQSMFRATTREAALGGQVIPAGRFVRAWIASANRDEAHFGEPERFDPRRSPNRHLAFGVGMHFCLGAPLARLEAQIALPALYRRFPDLAVIPGRPIRYFDSDVVHGPTSLPVRLSATLG